ncbi:MAG TPA: long-chain fatty acid--CoA ligase [Acidimicrobiales bacterium]|nr:long-chain fatty acid--CoA ligase [Acidimicrobiales bacterium]
MRSTMQDAPLVITDLFRHGRAVYGNSEIVTLEETGSRRASYAEVADRSEKLAAALQRLGIEPGDRVATFSWNVQEHFEAYMAVPCMGAVLHTLNFRLFPEQLTYIVNHAEDRVVIVHHTNLPLLAAVMDDLKTVEHVIVVGPDTGEVPNALSYDELLGAEDTGFAWPEVDERSAAAMCYTSGTTGNPKGVVYSHRSTYLHSLAEQSGASFGLNERDRILPLMPMFHANAWGLPYAGWSVGADFLLPNRFAQAEPFTKFIEEEKATFAGAVPTVWNDVLRYAADHPVDLSSLRMIISGGSAVPRSLIETFEARFGVPIMQAWGMTETSPLAAVAWPPKDSAPEDKFAWRAKTGRLMVGVELRITGDDGGALPWDGEAVGEIEVRGPWITGEYYKDDAPDKFHDGWLRTGDVGSVDPQGFIQITDRAKDVIKSGGEWISSVELEGILLAHPDVVEAAVIGVPDDRWDERPLACVVAADRDSCSFETLRSFLGESVARWQLPERWAFIDEVPKTSVGKYDKKVLRARYADGDLEVTTL